MKITSEASRADGIMKPENESDNIKRDLEVLERIRRKEDTTEDRMWIYGRINIMPGKISDDLVEHYFSLKQY